MYYDVLNSKNNSIHHGSQSVVDNCGY